jgi:hydrogenase maturation factor
LVPEAHIGDYVRVHVGFATERVSEEQAKLVYEQLAKDGQLQTAELDLEAEEALPETVRRQKHR